MNNLAGGVIQAYGANTYAYAVTPRVWRFTDADGSVHDVRVTGSLHANSGDALLAAALAGLGVIYEPDFMLDAALRAGTLKRLLPDHIGQGGEIWAVYPSRRHLSLKVRLFVAHVAQAFGAGLPPGSQDPRS